VSKTRKNYKRGRCLEAQRIDPDDVGEPRPCCIREFPCLIDILVLAGLVQPCGSCAPNVQKMRDAEGWERHPATHGTYYTSKHILHEQQMRIHHLIGQADIRNWVNLDPDERFG